MELGTLSDRLNYALSLTGTRKADLAKAIDVKPQVIQFLCNSKTLSSRFTFEIAAALGLNTHWLATGEGEIFIVDESSNKLLAEYTNIPVLNTTALRHLATTGTFDEDATETILIKGSHAKNDFAVHALDNAMHPVIPSNALLCFSSNVKKYVPNEIVIAYAVELDTFLIRYIKTDKNNQTFLEPHNTEFFKSTPLNDRITIFGALQHCQWTTRR